MKVIYKDGRCKLLNEDLSCSKNKQCKEGTCYSCPIHKEIDYLRHTKKDAKAQPNYNQ